jgi:chromosome segregation ATPase
MKINKLEIENVKRVRAVRIEPTKDGLTVIGGNNEQGKTSILDAITWALGGDNYRPSAPRRSGSEIPPVIKITMSNGLIVERKGKNSDLKVTDPTGRKGGQQLLNEFVEALALNLPKFMESSGKEKANTLLRIIGVGDKLTELEMKEKEIYNERLYVGRTADQKTKFAKEQPYYPDAPDELVSPSELIRQQQEILAKNGRNQQLRLQANELERRVTELGKQVSEAYGKAAEWEKKAKELERQYNEVYQDKEAAFRTAEDLQDESTEELERNIANIDEINRKVRANLDKQKAEDDARIYAAQYDQLTGKLEEVRNQKTALLDNAELPLPGLSVADGELTYLGQKWDNMSGSERLRVATAIVRKLNPQCGFVLLDKLEQMDLATLEEFGRWLEQEGLQAIATRVSTGDECSIIIEDGYVVKDQVKKEQPPVIDWHDIQL